MSLPTYICTYIIPEFPISGMNACSYACMHIQQQGGPISMQMLICMSGLSMDKPELPRNNTHMVGHVQRAQ